MIAVLARLVLAVVLLVAAAAKALDQRGTRETLRQFGVPGTRVAAGLLVAVEALTATAVLLDATAAGGAAVALLLLAAFSVALWRNRNTVTSCNCFGELGGGAIGPRSFVRNGALMLVALAVLVVGGDHLPAWLAAAAAGVAIVLGVLAQRRRRLDLKQFAGRDVVLVFQGEGCGPCQALERDLPHWPRQATEVEMLSPAAPRASFGLNATPGAVLIDREGRPASEPVYGAIDVEALVRGGTRPHGLNVTSHGVAFQVFADTAQMLDRIRQLLPHAAQVEPAGPSVEPHWTVLSQGAGAVVYAGFTPAERAASAEPLLATLAAAVRLHVAEHAPDRAFIHAGVVAWRNRVIVIPGRSYTGKSSFVAALLRAGATYFSDEYAVLDAEGLVHPYLKPISLREPGSFVSHDHDVNRFTGGDLADGPLPLGAVVVAPYEAGATWRPAPASAGAGAMALIANAVGVRSDPPRVMATIRAAAERAVSFDAPRGEAAETATALLSHLDAMAASRR
jgi:uncharacterized membrane protein YphA (DoxX/SURF4 family)